MMNQYQSSGFFLNDYRLDDKIKNPPSIKVNHTEISEPLKNTELYELCQQLTKENRQLKRQNSELKKLFQTSKGEEYVLQNQKQDYRSINYDNYKKKIMQVMASVKLLYGMYCQKTKIRDINKILDCTMNKIKNGNTNMIIELVRIFDEHIKNDDETLWDIQDLMGECSDYQNQMLRKHIGKMYHLLRENIFELKRDVNHAKEEIIYNRDKIGHEIGYYYEKYLDFKPNVIGREVKDQQKPNHSSSFQYSQVKGKKNSNKKATKSQNQNVSKDRSWAQIVNERERGQQRKKIQPNVAERLSESLNEVEPRLTSYSVPLQKKSSIPPRPANKSRKSEKTIVDQLQESKKTGYSVATPKSRGSINRSHLKELSFDYNNIKVNTPTWNKHSGRKNYR